MDIYTQTTADTCLPSCLMMALEKKGVAKPSQSLELEILVEGDKLSKFNRIFGHLCYVTKKFKLKAYYYSSEGSIKEAKDLAQRIDTSNIKMSTKPIDSRLVKKLLRGGIVMVVINDFFLREEIHFPHTILIDKFANGKFTILDPWEGKEFVLTLKELDQAMSLLDKLLFPKELIVLI